MDWEFLECQAQNNQHLKPVLCSSDAAKSDLAPGFMNWLSGFNQAWKWLEVTPCEKSCYWLYKLRSLQKSDLERVNLLRRDCWWKPHPFVVMRMAMIMAMIMCLYHCACVCAFVLENVNSPESHCIWFDLNVLFCYKIRIFLTFEDYWILDLRF